MPGGDLIQTFSQFGPLGLLIGYLILREAAERKDKKEIASLRADVDRAEIASRLELSRTLTMLCMVIQGRADV